MKYQRDLYREMISIERAGHFPYLSAFASRAFKGQADSGFPSSGDQSWSTTAGLRLSLPLFAGGSVLSRTGLGADVDYTQSNLDLVSARAIGKHSGFGGFRYHVTSDDDIPVPGLFRLGGRFGRRREW